MLREALGDGAAQAPDDLRFLARNDRAAIFGGGKDCFLVEGFYGVAVDDAHLDPFPAEGGSDSAGL